MTMGNLLGRSVWHAHCHAAFSHGDATAPRRGIEYAPFAATSDDSPACLAASHRIVPPRGRIALFTRWNFPRLVRAAPCLGRAAEGVQMSLHPHALARGILALRHSASSLVATTLTAPSTGSSPNRVHMP